MTRSLRTRIGVGDVNNKLYLPADWNIVCLDVENSRTTTRKQERDHESKEF